MRESYSLLLGNILIIILHRLFSIYEGNSLDFIYMFYHYIIMDMYVILDVWSQICYS